MAPEKVFLEVARKLLEFNFGSHLATEAVRSAAEGSSLGALAPSGFQGQRPGGGPGAEAPEKCLTLLPIFEHGLQFRFNEITYFLEH